MSDLTADTMISQSSDVITREINGKVVILAAEGGIIHELDDVDSSIWNTIAEPVSVDTIVRGIVDEYDVEETTAKADAMAFLSKLLELGVVTKR